jgi:hypothetical protein
MRYIFLPRFSHLEFLRTESGESGRRDPALTLMARRWEREMQIENSYEPTGRQNPSPSEEPGDRQSTDDPSPYPTVTMVVREIGAILLVCLGLGLAAALLVRALGAH